MFGTRAQSRVVWTAAFVVGAVLLVPKAVLVQGGRGAAPPGGFAAPTDTTPYDDYTGFTRLFDGQTLRVPGTARPTSGPWSTA